MNPDLALAFALADRADAETAKRWNPDGQDAKAKRDGSPVTEADIAAEEAMLTTLRRARASDGFLGEEVGAHGQANGRRWIADGIDGTRFFAAGERTWGTLLALEVDGVIVLGVSSSPLQDRRWWATRGEGAFCGRLDGSGHPEQRRVLGECIVESLEAGDQFRVHPNQSGGACGVPGHLVAPATQMRYVTRANVIGSPADPRREPRCGPGDVLQSGGATQPRQV